MSSELARRCDQYGSYANAGRTEAEMTEHMRFRARAEASSEECR